MKTFNDLEFKQKFGRFDSDKRDVQATLDFPNGYGVSVIQGPYSFTTGPDEYELAVFRGGCLCYDTPITSDVEGHLKADEVTALMRQIQELPVYRPTTDESSEP